ncbi:MAG: hypothetical protein JWO53_613 [Chlamydiia bacterium]|nr:hypothetical protein [Chlamydiia bacterium]
MKALFFTVCITILSLQKGMLGANPAPANRLQHSIENHEAEISYLKQKIENQEAIIETLREEVSSLIKATKELSAKSQSAQDAKLSKLEKNLEKLVADMKQFKTHANENAELIEELQKTSRNQAAANKLQENQLEALETALKSLAKAMQTTLSIPKESAAHTSGSTYRVKNGDSLAKIAKEHNTTTRELKQVNGLQSDKIVTGQELKIP